MSPERAAGTALTRRIEEQLAGAGLQVTVESSDGTLILNGIVASEEARQAATDVASQVAPNVQIDNQLDVESVLPTNVDDFVGEEPTAEMADSTTEIVNAGGELEPDFTDRSGLEDPIAISGDPDSSDEDPASTGEVYTPPVDPVLTTDQHGDARVLGGFEIDSSEDVEVESSAEDRAPGDEALADAIRRELAEDASTTDLNIVVAVRRGVAHLRGRVEDMDDVDNAEAVAARVPGVRDVVEELEVPGL